jgi:hypothetical protein
MQDNKANTFLIFDKNFYFSVLTYFMLTSPSFPCNHLFYTPSRPHIFSLYVMTVIYSNLKILPLATNFMNPTIFIKLVGKEEGYH